MNEDITDFIKSIRIFIAKYFIHRLLLINFDDKNVFLEKDIKDFLTLVTYNNNFTFLKWLDVDSKLFFNDLTDLRNFYLHHKKK